MLDNAFGSISLENYAMKILVDHGCDCYTYGDETSKTIMDDLKSAYPDGMEYGFHYLEVANAILAMSRPRPIARSSWKVCYSADNFDNSFSKDDFESAKDSALDVLGDWMLEESVHWVVAGMPSETEKEEWDYMINSCEVYVSKYDPSTDEYKEYWYPDSCDLENIGWKAFDN